MRWPLRRQITIPLVAVALLSLATLGAINAVLAGRHTRERIERQLHGVINVLANSNFPLTDSVLRQMRQLSQAEFVLTDDAGIPLASSTPELRKAPAEELPVPTASEAMLGEPLRLANVSFLHTATELPPRAGGGARILHVLFPEAEYERSWREAFLPPLLIGLACVAAVTLVARLLAGRISAATVDLGGEVLRMARGNFAPLDVPAVDDELRDLSLAVNRTAVMLADYEQHVRHTEQMRTVALLGAGLAHEMRNAATACRMALDLHAESCPQASDETLAVAKRQLQLMENQLQRLLRAGAAPSGESLREFDMAQLVEELLPLVRPAAKHAGVALEWRPSAENRVRADEEAIGQVVLNLLINAIEAARGPVAAQPSHVRIELRRKHANPPMASLTVADSGPGPSEQTAAALFDPFVTTKPEGIGLGLAVAKQVVETYQGRIGWTRVDGETQFNVEIPLVTKGEQRV